MAQNYFNQLNPYNQNYYSQTPMVNNISQRPYNNGIIWVQGLEGAKAYIIAPNSNVILLDSETEGIFYIKTSDNIGMCNLRKFKYKEISDNSQESNVIDADISEYATKKEINELKAMIKSLRGGNNDEQSLQSVKSSKFNSRN